MHMQLIGIQENFNLLDDYNRVLRNQLFPLTTNNFQDVFKQLNAETLGRGGAEKAEKY